MGAKLQQKNQNRARLMKIICFATKESLRYISHLS